MVATKNFNLDSDPKLACTCTSFLCDKRVLQQWVLDFLQVIREDLGHSMIVTSGGRCLAHPDEARKSKPGKHTECTEVDISCSSSDDLLANKLMLLAGRYGATRIARGNGFVHIGWYGYNKDKQPRIQTWEY